MDPNEKQEGPYLPRPEAPQPAPQANGKRTLILWGVLILIFVAIYQLVSANAPAHARPEAEPADGWSALSLMGPGVVFAVIAWCVLWVRRVNAVQPRMNEAIAKLRDGDTDGSDRILDELAARYRWPGTVVVMIAFNRASGAARRGDFARAIALYERAFPRVIWNRRQIRHAIAVEVAWCHSLAGDLAAAERWLTTAAGLAKDEGAVSPLLVETVVALRRGKAEETAARLAERWPELERTLVGVVLRPLRVLWAFALAQLGPRGAGQVEAVLAPIRPLRPGEMESYRKAWPEMALFLDAHGG